jgi:hypothetical protein
MTSEQQIVTHFFNATKNDLEDKNQFTLQNLKDFVKSKNYRNIGCKKEMIERVLWICNPNDYPKPDNIELKARGRPSTNNNSNTNNNTSNNTSNAIKNTIDIHTYKQAKCKEDLLQLKARELKDIIQSHKYRYVGSKKQLIDRVWWILHKDTEKPEDIELKSRGRPSFKNNYVVQFINDDSEESINSSCDDDDDGDYNEYIWTILFIQDGKINTENKGKKYFKFKETNYLFKKTIISDYLIYGELNENKKVSLIEIKKLSDYSEVIQNVIKEVCCS